MSKMQRDKGARRERSVVKWHIERGTFAERVPLSGARAYKEITSDVDCYPFGRECAPLTFEVKGRANGEGFKTLWNWMGTADALVLIQDRAPPLFVLSEAAYERLLLAAKRAP